MSGAARGRDDAPATAALAPAPARAIPRGVGVALLLLIAATFGSNHVAARLAFDHGVSVQTAVAFRSVATSLFVAALLRASGARFSLPAPTLARGLGLGLLVTVQSGCLYSAVARIPVALALLVFNTFPVLLALLSWASGGERPVRRVWVAMPIALAGLALALDVAGMAGFGGAGSGGTGAGAGGASSGGAMGEGVAYAFGASVAFATVLHLTTRWLGEVDGRLRTLMLMSVVSAVTLVAGAVRGGFALPADATGWVGLGLLTVLYSTAITAFFVVLPRLGAVNNAAIMNFEPIAALGMGWIVLGQVIAPVQVAGALVVIGAIVLLTTGKRA
ncbi:MAG: DMT family transporter [Burkholderiaceae bacterium]